MNEVILGKLLDIAFTGVFTKLNRDAVAAEAKQLMDNGGTIEDVLDHLRGLAVSSEDSAQAAIDAMPD